MHFLKTLFWVILALALVLFSIGNWNPVTLNLWGGLQMDVKLPLLILCAFLLGFLPTLIVHRARIWSLKRRLELSTRPVVTTAREPSPTIVRRPEEERVAPEGKTWPAG